MTRSCFLSILILCSQTVFSARTEQPFSQELSLVVYVYNNAGVDPEILAQAEDRAGEVFRRSGILISWYDCSVHGSVGRDCSGQLDTDAVVVQVVHDGSEIGRDVYGAAFLGADGHGQHTDVFFDQAKTLCSHVDVGLSDLLGYVIAHEIGHLLLGSGAHSWLGIMTAVWQSDQLQQLGRGRLTFLPQQSRVMRRRLAAISSLAIAESRVGD